MDRSPDTDSLCALMDVCSLSEKEKATFQAQLADFPHTFQLQDQERLGPRLLERLKIGLESALSVGFETTLETARARNLLAYILHQLRQPKHALRQLDLVLEMEDQKNNLVTLANKAVILRNQMQLSETDELVQSLVEMKKAEDTEFHYLVARAKAELAFTYTRLGPSFFPYAVAKFEEVIPKARGPEQWTWKFGLALTRRRRIRAKPQDMAATPSAESAAEQRDLLRLLMDIGENCGSRNLKAKVYSELALLLFMVSKTPLRQEFRFRAHMDDEQACEKALKLDPEDNSVLCKCGRIFRYRRQTERSRELLEKALAIRPSSTGYHHLGITYKALATSEKYKDQRKVPAYYRQMERSHAGHRGAQNYNSARQFRQAPSGRSQFNRNASAHFHDTVNTAAAPSSTNDVPKFSQDRDVRVMQRIIKSPPRGVTQFRRDDKFIKEALENFQKAIEFSQGENTRALYDLALLLKTLGELEEAYVKFNDMLKQSYNLFVSDKICVYEQVGLILKEQAESETDEEQKRHKLKNSTTMFYLALTSASEIFSRSPGIKEHIRELYQSFHVLLQEIEQSGDNHHWKLQEKARLFQLIKDHKQSLELLQEIEQMDPENAKDPKYLKHCIVNYNALGEFEKALTFVKLLECTAHSTTTMNQFGDKNYVMKIQMQAGRQALLRNEPSFAKLHFRSAFLEATSANQNEESSSECESTDSSEEGGSDAEMWDVAILHEETKESSKKAIVFSTLLEDVFGLKVAVTGRDAPANKLDQEGELRILKKSTMVLVLAGGKISKDGRLYINNIAKRRSTVTLLVDGDHVPKMLKANRSLVFPPELLQRCKSACCGKTTESEQGAICQFKTAVSGKTTESEHGAICQFKTADSGKMTESEEGAICQSNTADSRKMTESEEGAICQSKTADSGKTTESEEGAICQSKTADSRKMTESEEGAVCQSKTADSGKTTESEEGAICQSKTADSRKMTESEEGAVCQSKTADSGKMTEAEADAICQVFSFLVNVGMILPEA